MAEAGSQQWQKYGLAVGSWCYDCVPQQKSFACSAHALLLMTGPSGQVASVGQCNHATICLGATVLPVALTGGHPSH